MRIITLILFFVAIVFANQQAAPYELMYLFYVLMNLPDNNLKIIDDATFAAMRLYSIAQISDLQAFKIMWINVKTLSNSVNFQNSINNLKILIDVKYSTYYEVIKRKWLNNSNICWKIWNERYFKELSNIDNMIVSKNLINKLEYISKQLSNTLNINEQEYNDMKKIVLSLTEKYGDIVMTTYKNNGVTFNDDEHEIKFASGDPFASTIRTITGKPPPSFYPDKGHALIIRSSKNAYNNLTDRQNEIKIQPKCPT
uniref:Uncharacterized protein n=1 Tax=Babjeviella inositovora TaxID=45609 RepID=Q7Z8R9_9ASCO|nr:hypothetical protein [Babjeviella inositovora]